MELEKELVFRRNWLLVGHASEIPNPGDFMTLDAADERALVVRGHGGEVRAFHDLCRHRGSRVVAEPSGNCGSVISCPFHGWSYDLDGRLRGIPFAKTFGPLDRSTLGLQPVRTSSGTVLSSSGSRATGRRSPKPWRRSRPSLCLIA